jgi:protein-S-isoprenylcysteine O-methyltransferase Ste14
MPPVYFLVTILLIAALHWSVPIATLIHAPVSYIGALIIGIGIYVVVVPARLFQVHSTAIRPFEESSALVTEGVYRLTRNPMYLGMIIVLTGVAFLLGTLVSFLPIPVFAGLIQRQFIVKEEAMLEDTFGDRYLEYKKSVRRWI